MRKKALFESTKTKTQQNLVIGIIYHIFKSEQKQIEILFVHEGSSWRKHVNIECEIKNNLAFLFVFFNKITQINEINIKHI